MKDRGAIAMRDKSVGLALALAAAAAVALFLSFIPGFAQSSDPETQWDYPLVGDDGQRVSNHTIKLPGPLDALPGVVVVGNPSGHAALVEFYDLNCPYCRQAATDLGELLARDRELRLVLAPYPVLGIPSISAARVELAIAKLGSAEQFYAFHRKIYAQRGTIDGRRALEVAKSLGLNTRRLLALADSDEITETMKNHVTLGDALGLQATPSFVVGELAILGYPGPRATEAIVTAAAACGKAVC
jgi:protein-disulfide isomerase